MSSSSCVCVRGVVLARACMYVCVCVCVCVCERERERESVCARERVCVRAGDEKD